MNQSPNYDGLIEKIQATDTKHFVMMSYDKAEAVKLANFLRQNNFVVVIESSYYCAMPLHKITITKP